MRKIYFRLFFCCLSFFSLPIFSSSQIVISQVYGGGGNSGAPLTHDFVELFNRGNTSISISGWSIQYTSATGTGNFGSSATQITPLPAVTILPGQYFLVQEASTAAVGAPLPTPDFIDPTPIAMAAGAGKIALVNTTTLLGCNGVANVCTPAALATIVDLVGYGNANFFEGAGAAPTLSNTTAARRLLNGCTDNNNNATDFVAGAPTPRNTATPLNNCSAPPLVITNSSPLPTGTVNAAYSVTFTATGGTGSGYSFSHVSGTLPPGLNFVSPVLSGTPLTTAGSPFSFDIKVVDNGSNETTKTFNLTINPEPCNPPTNSIATIQGSGNTSPLVGSVESARGVVTGVRSNGFFIQTPDAEADGNPNTSEGIFVFTSIAPSVLMGNMVCVTGTIAEFIPASDPFSLSQTEFTFATVTVLGSGNPLPAPIQITAADMIPNGIDQLEKYEGMRVMVNSMTVVAPTEGNKSEPNATSTSNGIFYGVVDGIPRPFREPGITVPDPLPPLSPAGVPRFDANPERIRVGSTFIGGPAIDVNTGATLTNVVGPLDFGSRSYTIDIDPTIPPVIANNAPIFTPVPMQLPAELTVASFNMERFYDDVNDPGGDVALTTIAYNNRLNKVSLGIRNVLRTPDIIGVIEVEKLSVLQAIAAKVNNDAVGAGDPNPNYTAYLVEGNDPGGIDVGFLVKSARVNVISVVQHGLGATYINPNTSSLELLNDRPPLVLNGTFNKPGCSDTYPFTVIVNHLRSLIGVDEDPGDGNRVRHKRRAQAEYLANLIQAFQTADPAAKIISVGDYNAFQFNDGYVDLIGTIKGTPTPASDVVLASPDLVNPDLMDLVNMAPPDQRYSFVFEGNAQELDHILITSNLSGMISRYHVARMSADFAETNRSNPLTPLRTTDHDVPVTYILFPDVTPPVLINPEIGCSSFNQNEINQCLSVATLFDPTSLFAQIATVYVDECDANVELSLIETIPGPLNSDCSWTLTYRFKIEDNNENFVICEVIYTGGDKTAPVFTAPPDITIPFTTTCGYNSSEAITGSPSNVSDNCGGPVITSFFDVFVECDNNLIITRTWSAKDACNNESPTQVQTITVTDNATDYIIYASKEAKFGEGNMINGDVGVTDANGKADFKKNTVLDPYHVYAKNIHVHNPASVNNTHSVPATGGPNPPFFAYSGGGLGGNYTQNSNGVVPPGDFKHLTIKKGVTATVNGNNYGKVTIEENATVTFTNGSIDIEDLHVKKGKAPGRTTLLFTQCTGIRIKDKVDIEGYSDINLDGPKLTFYMLGTYQVSARWLRLNANTHAPQTKFKVHEGDEGTVITGWHIVKELECDAKNVTWNPYGCVPLVKGTITQSKSPSKLVPSIENFSVNVSPNPSSAYFSFRISSDKFELPVSLRIIDMSGRLVSTLYGISANSTILAGQDLKNGVYIAEIMQGTEKRVVKLVKL